MSAIKKFLKDPLHVGAYLLRNYGGFIRNDKAFLMWYYFFCMHKFPNLKSPVTFNEKLNWLKLNDRQPAYTNMVDKLKVKDIVTDIIGEHHVIKTLAVWNSPESIDWDVLPNRFVLKTTMGG